MKILNSEMCECRQGPEKWFTGSVWLDEIVTAAAPARIKALRVSFEPGAHTAWHTHPVGQALYVLAGVGLVQLKGQPAHGAAPGHTMVHLAIQETDAAGEHVVWLTPVSDEEYAAATKQ